jgi:phosphatidylserine/phosphatidylglycerophosphate/cardiolipin synthase-like enzyme
MDELWATVAALATALHRDRIEAVASILETVDSPTSFDRCRTAFGPGTDQTSIEKLKADWMMHPKLPGVAIAAALRAANCAASVLGNEASVDLVWTGPKTGLIPTRKTEQVICEVIKASSRELFIVSYVFHKAASIISALNEAAQRSVKIRILLESSTDHGGVVSIDGLTAMRNAVPDATFYIWDPRQKAKIAGSLSASVHAKCAVSDHRIAFITSANLTAAAMERNMELGVLLRGGNLPSRLHSHLDALISTSVATKHE